MNTPTTQSGYTTKGGLVIDERGYALDADTIARRLNERGEAIAALALAIKVCDASPDFKTRHHHDLKAARALLARIQSTP